MKFDQIVKCNKKKLFLFKNHTKNEAERLVFFFKKSFLFGKSKWSAA